MNQTTQRPPRGRPRPQSTIDRDKRVYALLKRKPLTRNQIADEIKAPRPLVALSLRRLREENKVRLCLDGKEKVWTVGVGDPCP